MFVWAGLRVVGAGGPVKKGVFEIIESVTGDGDVTLSNGVYLTAHQAIRSLRLCYAITYARCQGLTLPGIVRLDCTASPHFTVRHLYVGSSRPTSHQLLEIVCLALTPPLLPDLDNKKTTCVFLFEPKRVK